VTGTYASRFIADRHTVSIFEVSTGEGERTVRVKTGAGPGWDIVLPSWSLPSVAVLPGPTIAVWSVSRLFLLAEGKPPIRVEFDDEVHAVYAVGRLLCVVCELAVLIYDPERASIVDRYEAEDVLGDSRWEGEKLLVESFSGPPLAFFPSAAGVGLVQGHPDSTGGP
jgi:hypothetical protein